MIRDRGSLYDHDPDGHEKFRKLSALANSGTLSPFELLELEAHLSACYQCAEIHREYELLTTTGMPFLASAHPSLEEDADWDDSRVRQQLLIRVSKRQSGDSSLEDSVFHKKGLYPYLFGSPARQWITAALSACLFVTVSLASYHLGRARQDNAKHALPSIQKKVQELAAQNSFADDLLQKQSARIIQVEERSTRQQQEVSRVQTALHALEQRSAELLAAKSESEQKVLSISRQRDSLTAQLQQAEQAYRSAQVELASLRVEHDRELLHVTALESKNDDLAASNRGLEQKIADTDRLLASDRDIRELMGARKLYIADVFDVDSGSRTRKPFGRIFYTQKKSLIFYAFDLDRQPGVRNTSIFQVWGQKDAELTKNARATNLGILYADGESNRRWVLRLDDPKQLAEIDAVFVTVEPHGGSPKPTGKPLLYALLRKEANHP
ncbi:MAG: hypothetical protein JWQ87_2117 [Candidatus Sulfotelmatobacter sp.]|nr:hypothetical protein [Candidatus Sulfotelmatobacter sp.]